VNLYLDANVLVALLIAEPLSLRAEAFLSRNAGPYIASNFAAAEFSSAISRRVRTCEMSRDDGRVALATFDAWLERSAQWTEIEPGDIERADAFLRRLDLTLLTPDAIHIAMARRLGATLVTFDRQMAASAGALGADVTMP
jgi:predicted nucleic acid-binding protein